MIREGVTVRSTTVDEIPSLQGPESRMISGLSSNSFCAFLADVGEGWPDMLALVVVMGNFLESSLQITLFGILMPILSVPAVTLDCKLSFLFKIKV